MAETPQPDLRSPLHPKWTCRVRCNQCQQEMEVVMPELKP